MIEDTISRRAPHPRWLFAGITALCAFGCRSENAKLEPPAARTAFAGLDSTREIPVTLDTDQGQVHCQVNAVATPAAAALFIGLSRGRAAWREPTTGRVVTRPLYQNLSFHRAIPNVMIQSGCPIGDGTGNPGYRIAIETNTMDAVALSRPGALVLARYTPAPGRLNPNPPPPRQVIGSQFVITLVNMQHLAGQVTVIGQCQDLEVVRRISQLVGGENTRVTLQKIRTNER